MVAAVSTAATGFALVGDAAANRRLAAAPPCVLLFAPLQLRRPGGAAAVQRRKRDVAVCFVVGAPRGEEEAAGPPEDKIRVRVTERAVRKQLERRTYLVAAVMSSFGITSMAVMAVYYRFAWQMEGGDVPVVEMFGTFALSVGAAVGMEFWARWAHRALWHASLWHMHESHHRPREGPFELNDVFAIINAGPAIALLAYGFFNRGFVPGLCFGAGLGITLFGMAYMFVHDGLVHRRFPVGPIANVPYFRRVAAAHQIHHMDKFEGVPYGLFMGPKGAGKYRKETRGGLYKKYRARYKTKAGSVSGSGGTISTEKREKEIREATESRPLGLPDPADPGCPGPIRVYGQVRRLGRPPLPHLVREIRSPAATSSASPSAPSTPPPHHISDASTTRKSFQKVPGSNGSLQKRGIDASIPSVGFRASRALFSTL